MLIDSDNAVETDPFQSVWNLLKMLEPLHHRLHLGGTQLWPGDHLCYLYFPLHEIYQSPTMMANFVQDLENFLLPENMSRAFCSIGLHSKKAWKRANLGAGSGLLFQLFYRRDKVIFRPAMQVK